MAPRSRSRRATIADVAKRAQVSITTVSRVLSNSAQVREETTARVLSAVDELNYRPHLAARSLASRRTSTLGLVLPKISGDFFAPLLGGIEAAARAAGFNLLVSAMASRQRSQQPIPLGEHNTDGLLVFTDSLPESEIRRLHDLRFPLVLLHRTTPADTDVPCVTFENKSGARLVMQHLLEVHGFRRIAFLRGDPEAEDAYWRETGFREALAAHGLPLDPALVGEGGFDREIAYQQVKHWLQAGLNCEAIFASDDASALGAIQALQAAGVRVPEDIAVVGFDDVPLARYLTPPLTTVHAPIEAAGSEAVRLLVSLIRGEPVEPLILLPTQLVIRRSCGCVPGNGASAAPAG